MKYQTLTKNKLELFVELGLLTQEQIQVLRTRVQGYSITQQAMMLNVSESTICRLRKSIDNKFNIVCREYPDIFMTEK